MIIILSLARLNYWETQLENTVVQADNAANGILKNVTIAVPLKYLSNFWRSLETPLINCKVELKLNGQTIMFCLQLLMIILIVVMMILILLSRHIIISSCCNFISKRQ